MRPRKTENSPLKLSHFEPFMGMLGDRRQTANYGATLGFPSRLRWALLAAPLLILAAGVIEFYWRFSPLSLGASVTAKTATLGAIIASVSVALGTYLLIRFPASRNVEAFVLTVINAPIFIASFAFLVFKLTEPPSGFIAVNYDGLSASSVFLIVENKSTQAIYIRSDTDKKVWPGFFRTTCRTFDSEQFDPMVIVDGIYSTIKVAPGGRVRLDVPTELPNQLKDKQGYVRCRIRLSLEGGTFIDTYDFEPK
jgi:hypothetical protein